jgi:hypothetical protein
MDDTDPEAVPREQLETALEFLESCHGESLRRPWSDEAHAYYRAIDIIEAAMDEELRPATTINHDSFTAENIQRSREAREEGYAAATLLNNEKNDQQPGKMTLLQTIKAGWSSLFDDRQTR